MAGVDGRDPREDYKTLLSELEKYDKSLLKKPRLVVANKMDLEEAAANLTKFKRRYKVDTLKISCSTGEGLDGLKNELRRRVGAHRGMPAVASVPAL
jgi:GTP-binding protein